MAPRNVRSGKKKKDVDSFDYSFGRTIQETVVTLKVWKPSDPSQLDRGGESVLQRGWLREKSREFGET